MPLTFSVCTARVQDSEPGYVRYVAIVTMTKPDVLVIGAGVSGLSTALCLLESGLTVTVQAADLPQHTTSAVAGALWGPHLVGTDERVRQWAAVTLDRLRQLAGDPATGVREVAGLVASRADQPPPPAQTHPPAQTPPRPPGFTQGAGTLTWCDPTDLPAGYTTGWRYTAPVIAMATYLDYLTDELLRAGGRLHIGRPLARLADAASQTHAAAIVNCAGLGARQLVPDPELTSVRGQIVVLANPGLTEFFVGESEQPEHLTYLFPHATTVVLGGTQQPGDTSTQPDPATAARIVRDCTAIEPRLAAAPILAHRVGLRPMRPQVRLEAQVIDGAVPIVHNYGHGGAGVTLSWGCAQAAAGEVVRLLG
jgi:D-amino-acid oxidase